MYMRNSGVAQAPESMDETMNTMLMKPPQKAFRLVGCVAFPPIDLVPPNSHGYMVILAQ